jgi:hypothetical protein
MTDRFSSAWLKIERAKEHVKDLNLAIGRFLSDRKSIDMIVDDNGRPGKRAIRIKYDKTTMMRFSTIIGDALHNLRSALDHMTWETISPFARNLGQAQFPVGNDGGLGRKWKCWMR